MAMGGPHHKAREVAEETGRSSESAPALGAQAPTGVGPALPLRESVPGEGQHWPPEATRSNVVTQLTPVQASSAGRRDVLQQTQLPISRVKG